MPAIALLLSVPMPAQVVGGTISGAVTDPTGAPISGAGVVIRNLDTGTERQLHTDARGAYSAPAVAVGG